MGVADALARHRLGRRIAAVQTDAGAFATLLRDTAADTALRARCTTAAADFRHRLAPPPDEQIAGLLEGLAGLAG